MLILYSQRDPITGKKLSVDELWLIQHTKKNKEGERVWSDPLSEERYVSNFIYKVSFIYDFISI